MGSGGRSSVHSRAPAGRACCLACDGRDVVRQVRSSIMWWCLDNLEARGFRCEVEVRPLFAAAEPFGDSVRHSVHFWRRRDQRPPPFPALFTTGGYLVARCKKNVTACFDLNTFQRHPPALSLSLSPPPSFFCPPLNKLQQTTSVFCTRRPTCQAKPGSPGARPGKDGRAGGGSRL